MKGQPIIGETRFIINGQLFSGTDRRAEGYGTDQTKG